MPAFENLCHRYNGRHSSSYGNTDGRQVVNTPRKDLNRHDFHSRACQPGPQCCWLLRPSILLGLHAVYLRQAARLAEEEANRKLVYEDKPFVPREWTSPTVEDTMKEV